MNAKPTTLLTALAMGLSVAQIYTCTEAWAAELAVQQLAAGTTSATGTAARKPINLNLNSTIANTNAGNMAAAKPISITVGGKPVDVLPTTPLTPAERLAVYQVFSTGQQSIILGAKGNAIGGSLTIGPKFTQYVSGITVPKNVSVYGDAAVIGNLVLTGNVSNFGNIFMLSSSQAVNSASISAANIINNRGGLITSVIPTSNLVGLTAAVQQLDLSLIAINNIINSGTISSSGNLMLSAGGSIVNGPAAIMQATGNVNLLSQTGAFFNSGMIASFTGNVNFNTGSLARDIVLNNVSGTLQALNGSINVRDSLFQSLANTNLTGGDLIAKELNVHSGTGSVSIDVGSLNGTVSVSAGEAKIVSKSQDLQIGNLEVSGTPYISSKGNLDLAGAVTGPMSYLIATAGANIYTSAATAIDTSSASGDGGNIVLVAGAYSTNNQGKITLTRSGTGGDVFLVEGSIAGADAQAITGIDASSTKQDGNGGNITILALASTSGSNTGGHVLLPDGVSLNASGSGAGKSGNVTVIAEAAAGPSSSIKIGSITSSEYGSAGGNVLLQVATANLEGVSIDANTGALSGSLQSEVLQNGQIVLNSITTGGAGTASGSERGSVTMQTLGGIAAQGTINTVSISGGNAGNIKIESGKDVTVSSLFAAGTQFGSSAGNGGAIAVLAGGDLTINGDLTSAGSTARNGDAGNGGAVAMSTTSGSMLINGNMSTAGGDSLEGGNGGNGGSISLTSTKLMVINGLTTSSGGDAGKCENGCNGGNGGPITAVSQTDNLIINGATNSSGGNGGESTLTGGKGGQAAAILLVAATGLSANGSLAACGGNGGDSTGGEGGAGGNGATVTLRTMGNLLVNGGIYSNSGAGGKNISVSANAMHGGNGNAGSIAVISRENVSINGAVSANAGRGIPHTVKEFANGKGAQGGNNVSKGNGAEHADSNGIGQIDHSANGKNDQSNDKSNNGKSDIAHDNSNNGKSDIAHDNSNNGKSDTAQDKSNNGKSDTAQDKSNNGKSEIAQDNSNNGKSEKSDEKSKDSKGEQADDKSNNGKSEVAQDKSNNGKSEVAQDNSNNGKSNLSQENKQENKVSANGSSETQLESEAAEVSSLDSESNTATTTVTEEGNGGDAGDITITSDNGFVDIGGEASAKGGEAKTPSGTRGKDGTIVISGKPHVAEESSESENDPAVLNGHVSMTDDDSKGNGKAQHQSNELSIANAEDNGNPLMSLSVGSSKNQIADAVVNREIQTLDNQDLSMTTLEAGKHVRIDKGNVLINPKDDMQVDTDKGSVKVAAGAMVLVMETGKDLAILNLHDLHRDDVQVVVDDKAVSLAPGQQMVLSKESTQDFDKVNPSQDIAVRNPKATNVSKDGSAFIADFSITSALGNVKVLKQMTQSTAPQDKKVAAQMMKMAAIATVMSRNTTPFQKGK